ncbi:hypothetical protein C8R46DRAFT_1195578 [Mycena filopes]|nr:hypothetical protein C8R46DRAFT_1195578 [Mycena filopes]
MTAYAKPAPLLPLHTETLRVAIVAENFLPKIDGSTITIARLLQYLSSSGIQTMLFGPESGMTEYAGAQLFGTFGIPLRVYPGLKINFISPALVAALRAFAPHVIHLVDPIWLGVQALCALQVLFPGVPVVTSHHTNLATYAEVFGYPYWGGRVWQMHAYLHSFAHTTLVPSHSTASLLAEKGFTNLKVVGRGVDEEAFSPTLRSPALRASWGASPSTVVILSVGRLSPEKNLSLLVEAFAILPPGVRAGAKLVFVGDGPWAGALRGLCAARGLLDLGEEEGRGGGGGGVVFTGQLTGRALGEAFASADVMSSPSITETFGQVTLQGMASGLPVVGLYVEGTADLVTHLETGLLLDVHACAPAPRSSSVFDFLGATPDFKAKANALDSSNNTKPWAPLRPLALNARIASYGDCHHMMRPPSYPSSSSSPSAPFPFSSSFTTDPSPAWPTLAGRYATLLETLIAGPDAPLLRARMGASAYERSRAYTWDACGARVLTAYVDAVGWGPPAASTSTSTSPTLKALLSPTTLAASSPALSPKLAPLSPSLSAASLILLPPPILAQTQTRTSAELSLTNVHAHTLSFGAPTPITQRNPLRSRSGSATQYNDNNYTYTAVLPAPLQTLVDAFVVVHALFAATLTHAAYMVPTAGDLAGVWVWER